MSTASTTAIAAAAKGIGSVTMTAPNAITRFQDAYVEKVIDTLNDLPNVLWVVSEEAPAELHVVEQPPDCTRPSLRSQEAVPAPDRLRRA